MKNKNDLIAYAMDFAAYLISKSENTIDRIILHGSLARGDYDVQSDVDLFIDSKVVNEKKLDKIYQAYQKTKRFEEWRLKGINLPISMIVGDLDNKEWSNLKRAMMNTGILLYGKFMDNANRVHHYVLISVENIKPEAKRVALYRKLFGFTTGKKTYPGLIQKYKGKKINKGTFMISIAHFQKIKSYLQKYQITAKYFDFWSDTDILA
ncbi:MAG: nucleotidyltransferase domain-containing protein [Candidatus Woesearchaeota archaeon]|jgi:predicted nucleotidyltransferase|nr:nucleotidyltransferase domain-containing protein [Candidatus Woesearchaeota archaeon]MDP7457639.1 nucleotidyltransferase domain-containing protein [Candidatus Woesearchaeota archaeon]